jgi:hypothetical protein
MFPSVSTFKSSSPGPRARALSLSSKNQQKARALEPRAPDSIHHYLRDQFSLTQMTESAFSVPHMTAVFCTLAGLLKLVAAFCGGEQSDSFSSKELQMTYAPWRRRRRLYARKACRRAACIFYNAGLRRRGLLLIYYFCCVSWTQIKYVDVLFL